MDTLPKVPYSHCLLDSQLSREIDEKTISDIGIDGFTLMEIAGSSAAKILLSQDTGLKHGIYLCGKGNNAGDALVVARYLIQNGISATVIFLSGTKDFSPSARKNLQLLKTFSGEEQLVVHSGWNDVNELKDFNFIVDGMLGTGLDSNVRRDYAAAVEWANEQSVSIFSMDIPTGLHADTGKKMGVAVAADQTFAFGGYKLGYYIGDGPGLTGKIHYCELPFPNFLKNGCTNFLIDSSWAGKSMPISGRHKYERGVLYIIAGSEGLTGAGIMAAQSAWTEGLGAVILICPHGILSPFEQNLPSIIKKPVGARTDYFFKEEHLKPVLNIVDEKPGSVLIGPGVGREPGTVKFIHSFLDENWADTVIDADALWCLSQSKDWSKPKGPDWILTPHPGELSRFVDTSVDDDHNRLQAVKQLSQEKSITLLSKGMPAMVGTVEGKSYITAYDTRPFARAGNGDVLAGKIAAFRAMGNPSPKSCVLGLLKGKEKLDKYTLHNENLPEPLDLI